MLFARFRLRFGLHLGTQSASRNGSTKTMEFWTDFEWILGTSGAPLCDHFGLQKSMKKHPSSKDPLQGRPMDAKRLQNDAKWSPKASKMDQKWNKNEAKRQPPRVTRKKKNNKIWMQNWIPIGPPRIEQRGVVLPCVQKPGRAGFPLGARRDSRSAGSIK